MENGIDLGITRVMSSENIAIVVLMVMVLIQFVWIGTLLRGLLKMKDVFHEVALAINTLNERLNYHHNDDKETK